MWAANQRRTAEENAQRGFERNGQAFGAATVDDYVRAAHAFVANPPKGAATLERGNGDRLIYDPKGNVFAVVTKAGAPRALFKPDDGAAYWAQQKAREAQRTSAAKTGEAVRRGQVRVARLDQRRDPQPRQQPQHHQPRPQGHPGQRPDRAALDHHRRRRGLGQAGQRPQGPQGFLGQVLDPGHRRQL
ncbi:MAG: hypothetical protein JWP92_1305, partial [Caulobacter sp.]|nr:hypothetical protein [Caulobacter sp.]